MSGNCLQRGDMSCDTGALVQVIACNFPPYGQQIAMHPQDIAACIDQRSLSFCQSADCCLTPCRRDIRRVAFCSDDARHQDGYGDESVIDLEFCGWDLPAQAGGCVFNGIGHDFSFPRTRGVSGLGFQKRA